MDRIITKQYVDDLCFTIIGCAIEVQKELGVGLLEKTYEKALSILLERKGLRVQSQLDVPVTFQGTVIDHALRLDLLVNDLIIVEIKSVERLLPVHEAQLLTYLKLLNKPKGILINFYCTNIFYKGQKTFVTDKYAALPAQ